MTAQGALSRLGKRRCPHHLGLAKVHGPRRSYARGHPGLAKVRWAALFV